MGYETAIQKTVHTICLSYVLQIGTKQVGSENELSDQGLIKEKTYLLFDCFYCAFGRFLSV